MKLFTLAELKFELWITDEDKDTELNLVIDRVSAIVENYLGYSLDLQTLTEYYDEWAVSVFWVTRFIADENSIVITEKDTWATYTLDYVDDRLIFLSDATVWGKVKIEYQTGYASNAVLPADLKGVALSWWVTAYNDLVLTSSWTSWDLLIKTKKLWTLSLTYFSPKESTFQETWWNDWGNWKPSDYSVLDIYKKTFIL